MENVCVEEQMVIQMTTKSCGILIADHPTRSDFSKIEQVIREHVLKGEDICIYLIDEGVFFILPEFWTMFEDLDCIIYASGAGAKRYNIPYRDEVIFSSLTTLNQLMQSCSDFIII